MYKKLICIIMIVCLIGIFGYDCAFALGSYTIVELVDDGTGKTTRVPVVGMGILKAYLDEEYSNKVYNPGLNIDAEIAPYVHYGMLPSEFGYVVVNDPTTIIRHLNSLYATAVTQIDTLKNTIAQDLSYRKFELDPVLNSFLWVGTLKQISRNGSMGSTVVYQMDGSVYEISKFQKVNYGMVIFINGTKYLINDISVWNSISNHINTTIKPGLKAKLDEIRLDIYRVSKEGLCKNVVSLNNLSATSLSMLERARTIYYAGYGLDGIVFNTNFRDGLDSVKASGKDHIYVKLGTSRGLDLLNVEYPISYIVNGEVQGDTIKMVYNTSTDKKVNLVEKLLISDKVIFDLEDIFLDLELCAFVKYGSTMTVKSSLIYEVLKLDKDEFITGKVYKLDPGDFVKLNTTLEVHNRTVVNSTVEELKYSDFIQNNRMNLSMTEMGQGMILNNAAYGRAELIKYYGGTFAKDFASDRGYNLPELIERIKGNLKLVSGELDKNVSDALQELKDREELRKSIKRVGAAYTISALLGALLLGYCLLLSVGWILDTAGFGLGILRVLTFNKFKGSTSGVVKQVRGENLLSLKRLIIIDFVVGGLLGALFLSGWIVDFLVRYI